MIWWIIAGILLVAVIIMGVISVQILIPKKISRELEQYQNELAGRQLEETRNIYHEMRGWRHDYKNHMQVLKIYVENQQWNECLSYMNEMNQDMSDVDHMFRTGNIMADAIVNSKVSLAYAKGIAVDCTIKIPSVLPVSDVEFSVIFGNLMDNAIEACDRIPEEKDRFIRIYIGLFQKQFYISVTNATNLKKRVNRYLTSKGDGHGFGLYRIDKIIKEKGGYLKRKDEPGVFATEIMLPFMSESEPHVKEKE